MSISIKKSNLKWLVLCIISIIALIFGISAIIQNKVNEKREQRELEEYVLKTIDREYKDLVQDYERYKETMEDYDYSYDMRTRYRRKINELVGSPILSSNYVSDEDDRQIRETLYLIARRNAYKKLLGD